MSSAQAHARALRRHLGLGTLVETLLKPFARLVDHLFGTRLTGCVACRRRRDRLDRWTAALTRRLQTLRRRLEW